MNTDKLFLRLLLSPLTFAMLMVASFYFGIKRFILLMWYGGEFISYRKEDKPMIHKIYVELKKQTQCKENTN
jgi:hypothetical protein